MQMDTKKLLRKMFCKLHEQTEMKELLEVSQTESKKRKKIIFHESSFKLKRQDLESFTRLGHIGGGWEEGKLKDSLTCYRSQSRFDSRRSGWSVGL